MKNKKMLLLAFAAVVIAVIAVIAFVNRDVAEIKTTEVVTVVQEATEAATDVPAAEEEIEIEITELTGMITEITDEYVMLDAGEMGMIQTNTTMDTLIEGVEELAVGQVAVVLYDGKMTRSLPAQITALKIGVYEIKGTVTEMADGRITVIKAEGGDEVVLTLPEGAPEINVGDAIIAYTTGVSTMSLPPQMNAIAIEIQGVDAAENG